ncbi:MAG TPA: GlsB/YeaQ/YmgE family stress response membrane protein [Pirellulales bacterium]|jgi:uncharacterized membrane protein YeaQ/YmgE (transglycosylase-associated protein family)|nr:GlsB/YeaQ/YmgE family stress response membrane protein [Pirellulales bacterium]
MNLFAEISLSPGGVISWIVVGLIAGWLAGLTMSGAGYGFVRDIVLGLIGALIGGFVTGFFVQGDAGFWGSVVVAFIGACILIGISRAVSPHRVRRI